MTQEYSEDEQYIIDESREISLGERTDWLGKLAHAFPAMESRNYQLYFWSQLVSLIGTWLQVVAQSWLVLELTNSAFLIGLVTALGAAPALFLSLFGGVIVDRFPKKYIIIVTQTSSMLLALVLGFLAIFHVINVTQIIVLSFLLGVVNAVDIPARNAYVAELTDKRGWASAIALNSGVFNAARVIGPSIAGLTIGLVGAGGAFILNGISYIPVIIALFFITTPTQVQKHHMHPLKAIKEGIIYSFSHPTIRALLIFVGVVSVFGWSYTTIMPVIAQNTFHLGATGLGYLYAAAGLGALVATLFVSAFGNKLNPMVLILGGNMLFAVSLILFTLTANLTVALILLFFAGVGLLAQFATMNTTIQHLVEDKMRGRVMSIYALMFLGLSPIGNFEIGYLADKYGTGLAMQSGCVIILLFGLVIYLMRKGIIGGLNQYNKSDDLFDGR